jgi:hypothetical protein
MAYLRTLLTYVHDCSQTHIINSFWYPDDGDFMAYNPPSESPNRKYYAGGI